MYELVKWADFHDEYLFLNYFKMSSDENVNTIPSGGDRPTPGLHGK